MIGLTTNEEDVNGKGEAWEEGKKDETKNTFSTKREIGGKYVEDSKQEKQKLRGKGETKKSRLQCIYY